MSESRPTVTLQSLQAKLHAHARELQDAEGTIHTLKLERLARDREICELKRRLFMLEAASIDAQDSNPSAGLRMNDTTLQGIKAQLAARAQELELQDQLVAAAEQERGTYLEYIEHLKSQLAQLQRQPVTESSPVRAAVSQAYAVVRRAINR